MKWHVQYGFQQSHYDKCYLYLKRNGQFIKISFHVDDGMVAHKGKQMWEQYKIDVNKRFDIQFHPLEERKKFLGMNFHLDRSKGICLIDQSNLVDKMLVDFGMQDCSTKVSTPCVWPLPTDSDLPESPGQHSEFNMYSALGYLNQLQGGTKPEISVPLKRLSRYGAHYGEKHIELAKRMMRWCKRTRNVPLVLKYAKQPEIQIFTDASHASCPDTRRSITGVVVKISGNTIFWKCLNQSMVSHSSTESELIALDKGATIGIYVRWLVECMTGTKYGTMKVFVDNQSTIALSSNPVHPDRNLHFHARFFYIRDLVEGKHYVVLHTPSEDMVSDILCTYKSIANFNKLYAILVGVAHYELKDDGTYVWRMERGRWLQTASDQGGESKSQDSKE